jgi:hypothetical protein
LKEKHPDLEGKMFLVDVSGIDLMNEHQCKDFIRQLKENLDGVDIAYAVIDTMRKTSRGNEDSATDQGLYIANVQTLASEIDGFVEIITHTGKAETRGARGSNVALTDVDCQWEHKKIGNKHIRVTNTKMKDDESGDTFTFKLVQVPLGAGIYGDPVPTTCDVEYVSGEIQTEENSSLEQQNKLSKFQRETIEVIEEAIHRDQSQGATLDFALVESGKVYERAARLSTIQTIMLERNVFGAEASPDKVRANTNTRLSTLVKNKIIDRYKAKKGASNDWVWML